MALAGVPEWRRVMADNSKIEWLTGPEHGHRVMYRKEDE